MKLPLKRIQNIAEEIKRNYIVEARKIIKGNEEILLQVQEKTNDWLSELTGEDTKLKRRQLKMDNSKLKEKLEKYQC